MSTIVTRRSLDEEQAHKTTVPTDADPKGNPGIGSSESATMSQSSPEELRDF
jgi:hypothetical protein